VSRTSVHIIAGAVVFLLGFLAGLTAATAVFVRQI
jgi:hypothetical protein